MGETMATSPIIKKPSDKNKKMSFGEALSKIAEGHKVTKLEWNNKKDYGYMEGIFLWIFRNGKGHPWKINEGDILGKDWIII